MCSTGKDSGQNSSEAHEDETCCDLSEKFLTCVLCVITLGPQVVVLFGKVIQTSERNFAGGSLSLGEGFDFL